jgi:hypothetical protein
MDLNSWEAARCAAAQEFPNILWNPKICYCVLESPPLVPIQSQISPANIILLSLRSILILFTHLCFGLPTDPFPSGFPANIYIHCPFIFSTCSSHVIFIDDIVLVTLDT